MLKGAQKKMIVVRTKDSRLFEEAYFVMRKDTPEISRDSGDILWEANRIIERNIGRHDDAASPLEESQKKQLNCRIKSFFFFAGGLACGGAGSALLFFLL